MAQSKLLTNQDEEEHLQSFHNKVYVRADSTSKSFIIGFFIVGLILALFYSSFLLAFFMGGISVITFFAFYTFKPNSKILRYATSFLLWNFGVQYLFQMQGHYEMHFFFFIGLTVLLLYEDWKVLLPAAIYALATITAFYLYRDTKFLKTHLPYGQNTSATSFLIHFSLLLSYTFICIRWSNMRHRQTRASAQQAVNIEKQLSQMEANINFANQISQGNLHVEYTASDTDKLGQSLLNMRNSLTESSRREEQERFSTTGLARVGEILRQQVDNINLLCDRVIEEVVKYMKANQGEIFMVEKTDENERGHLKLMACRAWDRKKYLQKTVDLGEGLAGQAALEKQPIFLTDVPNNYVSLSSGLGKANPACVLIVPLKSEDEVVGVIELASFKVFQDYEIKFLEKVGESIASTMISAQNNNRTKELLEKSNTLAEQMRAQEEAIRQNVEEMQATQEEMARKEVEIKRVLDESLKNEQLLKEKLKEIEQLEQKSKLESEKMLNELEDNRKIMLQVIEKLPEKIFLKDENGRLLLLNSALAAGYNKRVEDLLGKNDFDLFPTELATQFWKIEQEIIASNKPSTMHEDFPTPDGKILHLYTTKIPFHFPNTSKVGILGFQVDVTDIKVMENNAKKAAESLGELEALRQEVKRLKGLQ